MANLAKTGRPSLCSKVPPAGHQFTGIYAGEAIEAGDACRINSSGKVVRSVGAAADTNANVFGFAATNYDAGDVVTLFFSERFNYSLNVVPGKSYFLSTSAGQLSDTATTGGTVPVAYGLPDGRLQVLQVINK